MVLFIVALFEFECFLRIVRMRTSVAARHEEGIHHFIHVRDTWTYFNTKIIQINQLYNLLLHNVWPHSQLTLLRKCSINYYKMKTKLITHFFLFQVSLLVSIVCTYVFYLFYVFYQNSYSLRNTIDLWYYFSPLFIIF